MGKTRNCGLEIGEAQKIVDLRDPVQSRIADCEMRIAEWEKLGIADWETSEAQKIVDLRDPDQSGIADCEMRITEWGLAKLKKIVELGDPAQSDFPNSAIRNSQIRNSRSIRIPQSEIPATAIGWPWIWDSPERGTPQFLFARSDSLPGSDGSDRSQTGPGSVCDPAQACRNTRRCIRSGTVS
jgi:hypothetical protein